MRAGVLGMRERGIAPAPIKGVGVPDPVADGTSSVAATGVSGQIRFTFSTAPETYGAAILDMVWTDNNSNDPASANSLGVDSGDTFPLVRDYNGLTDDVEITNVYTAVKTAGGWSAWSEDIGPVTPVGNAAPEFTDVLYVANGTYTGAQTRTLNVGTSGTRDLYLIVDMDEPTKYPSGIVFDPTGDNITGTKIYQVDDGSYGVQIWKFASASNGGSRDFSVTYAGGSVLRFAHKFMCYEQRAGTSTKGTAQDIISFINNGNSQTLSSAVFSTDWSFVIVFAQSSSQSQSISRADAETPTDSRTFDNGGTTNACYVQVHEVGGTTNVISANSGANGYVGISMVPFTYD